MESSLRFLLVGDHGKLSCSLLEKYQLDNQQLSKENNPQPQKRDSMIHQNRKHVQASPGCTIVM